MFNQFDWCKVYHFDPNRQEDVAKEFQNVAWFLLADDENGDLRADQLAERFTDYGDYNLTKDSKNSCYIEFYYYEPTKIPSQTIEGFIQAALQEAQLLGIKEVVPYAQAAKFRSHNRIEYD